MPGALIALRIRVDGVPELQRTAEAFKQTSRAIKETEKDFAALDKQFRRGIHTPSFGPGWQAQAGARGIGATIGAGVGVAGGALMGAMRAHPLFTVAGALLASREAIRAFGQEEMILARTEALLRGQGITNMQEAGRVAEETARKTIFSKGQEMEAIGSLLLITNNYKSALSDLSIVNNIASVTGWDLNTAALVYGRALEGNTSTLGKYVQKLREMTEEQKKNQGLVRTTIAEAVRGQAEAQAQTPTGQLTQAKKDISEAMQVVGGTLTMLLAPVARGITGLAGGIHGLIISPEQEALLAEVERLLNPVKEVKKTFIDIGLETGNIVTKVQSETTITGGILALRRQISEELGKEDFSIATIAKSMRGILDLEEKRKKLQEEIAEIQAGPVLGRIGRVGALTGAVAGLGTGKSALMERFGGMELAPGLTLGKALSERAGITGFDVWKQRQQAAMIRDTGLPTGFRSQIAGELFQHELGMLGRATTPEMQATIFRNSVMAMNTGQRLDEQKARDDVADRQKLIGNTNDMVTLLGQIHSFLLSRGILPKEVSMRD